MILWQPGVTLANMEKMIIRESLRLNHGSKPAVASSLGISLRTVDNKLKEYDEEDRVLQQKLSEERQAIQVQFDKARGKNGVAIDDLSKGELCQTAPAPLPDVPQKQSSLQ